MFFTFLKSIFPDSACLLQWVRPIRKGPGSHRPSCPVTIHSCMHSSYRVRFRGMRTSAPAASDSERDDLTGGPSSAWGAGASAPPPKTPWPFQDHPLNSRPRRPLRPAVVHDMGGRRARPRYEGTQTGTPSNRSLPHKTSINPIRAENE